MTSPDVTGICTRYVLRSYLVYMFVSFFLIAAPPLLPGGTAGLINVSFFICATVGKLHRLVVLFPLLIENSGFRRNYSFLNKVQQKFEATA